MRPWVFLLISLPVYAAPGFFRDPADRVLERNAVKAGYTCMVRVAYNASQPVAVEVSGLTVACVPTMRQALSAAAVQGKVFVLGEPAKDPQYECAVQVYWTDPSAPVTTLAGDSACPAAQGAALLAASLMRY